jgi:hypothetical protein
MLEQGDQICCMKSTKTVQCKLCMIERREILHRFQPDKTKNMNHNSEIFGAYKCNQRFHQFYRNDAHEKSKIYILTQSTEGSRKTITPEPVLPLAVPVIIYDPYVTGLPYRKPTPNPTNPELDQVQHYLQLRSKRVSVDC